MGKEGLLIGITGQTGAGKTMVCRLIESSGCHIIDADLVARKVVAKGSKCTLDLAVEFGIEILNIDGTLNRKKLGNIVFEDKQKRLRLNRLTFPYIQEEIFSQVERFRQIDKKPIFLDAPTLIESGTNKKCDKIVSVIAPVGIRRQRIIERDNLTLEETNARISAQHEDEFYTSQSDFVIINDCDPESLKERVMEMLRTICRGESFFSTEAQLEEAAL